MPVLSDDVVVISIEFTDLTVPSRVVDGSNTDFDSSSFPPWDVIEETPSVSDIWLFEISVDDDVLECSESNKSDVVDDETKTIRSSSSFDLESVLSFHNFDCDRMGMDEVVIWDNRKDDLVVPNDVSKT